MKRYTIKSIERHLCETTYNVWANSPEEAEAKCKAGQVDYDDRETVEDDPQEEWVETVSIEERNGLRWDTLTFVEPGTLSYCFEYDFKIERMGAGNPVWRLTRDDEQLGDFPTMKEAKAEAERILQEEDADKEQSLLH